LLERDIEEKVGRYANARDILTRKFTSPQHRSVPDRLYTFPNGYAVYIEFKAPGKKPSDGQRREMNQLIKRKQWVYVVDDIAVGKILVDAILALPEGILAPKFEKIIVKRKR
jgi:hypothetical protein